MKTSNPQELKLHVAILEQNSNAFTLLSEHFTQHLLMCIHDWYGHIPHDESVAHEAVYKTLRHYSRHPRMFNPMQGSLKQFLEIGTNRSMQIICQREGYPLHVNSRNHLLTMYFDNALDIQLAKMMLRNESSWSSFANVLGLGGYPIDDMLPEIKRHQRRIKKKLDHIHLPVKYQRKKDHAVRELVYI